MCIRDRWKAVDEALQLVKDWVETEVTQMLGELLR